MRGRAHDTNVFFAGAAALLLSLLLSGCSCDAVGRCRTPCSGCCDARGECQSGIADALCGTGGALCSACGAPETCRAGVCASSDAGEDGGVDAGFFSAVAWCEAATAAWCDSAIRCQTVASAGKDVCRAHASALLCEQLLAAVDAGARTFDLSAAQACLAQVETAECESGDPLAYGPCTRLSLPAAAPGERCTGDSDCVDSLTACGGPDCQRSCQDAGALGQPCPRSGLCPGGLRCDLTAHSCAAPHALNDSCDPALPNQCAAGTTCDATYVICVALPGPSQPCRFSAPRCAPGGWCDSSAGACAPAFGEDAGCNDSSMCQAGLFCDPADYKCRPQVGLGAGCSADDCQPNLRCTDGVCSVPRIQGQPCQRDADCAVDLFCDGVLRTCQRRVFEQPIASACTDTRLCAGGLFCKGVVWATDAGVGSSGVCGIPNLGDPCTGAPGECPLHARCDGDAGQCTAAALGDGCTRDEACAASDYCAPDSTCAPRLDLGFDCPAHGCTSPFRCVPSLDGGTQCALPGALSDKCTGGASCQFPYACSTANYRCTAAGLVGQLCLSGPECLEGLCSVGGACNGARGAEGLACRAGFECASTVCQGGRCSAICP